MPIFKLFSLSCLAVLITACNLTVVNEGGGVVQSGSGLIDCGETCKVSSTLLENNNPPFEETLFATPDEGYEFVGWEGACSGTQTCTVRVTHFSGNKKVIAHFQPLANTRVLFDIGSDHACAHIDHGLECWGQNQYGQLDIPTGLGEIQSLHTGARHSCVTTESGLHCWGAGEQNSGELYQYGQSDVPDNIHQPSQVALGWNHTCVIESGQVVCWGFNEFGQLNVPEGIVNPHTLVAGAHHNCVLADSGVHCWGAGLIDEGGYPQAGQSLVPATVTHPSAIGLGNAHTCALQDNDIICWGEGTWGQLDVPEINGEIDLFAVGGTHACVVVSDQVQCWGTNQSGVLEIPEGLSDINVLQAGNRNVCVFAAEKLTCWGHNHYGLSEAPRSLARPLQLALAQQQICIRTEHDAHCWGSFTTNPDTLVDVVDVALGQRHGCYIDAGGLACYGDNNHQQSLVPAAIVDTAVNVEAGFDHNCAVNGAGAVTCWGDGWSGATDVPLDLQPVSILGLGNQISCALQPTEAVCWGGLSSYPLDNPIAIAVGNNHGCAIDNLGVHCWGYNSSGKLNVPTMSHASDIAVGWEHGCALAEEGVLCWGAGDGSGKPNYDYGQSVVPHTHLVNPRDVEANQTFSCALDDLGVYCWGSRNFRVITR
ncbi:MAG: hypothetical protein CMK89_08355 [Pseudomonadales bacterium]|nr:hypothetical protein [Pseudomonadales bacterium]